MSKSKRYGKADLLPEEDDRVVVVREVAALPLNPQVEAVKLMKWKPGTKREEKME
jgi:hypothetical protein